jgi:hypothetical protein
MTCHGLSFNRITYFRRQKVVLLVLCQNTASNHPVVRYTQGLDWMNSLGQEDHHNTSLLSLKLPNGVASRNSSD